MTLTIEQMIEELTDAGWKQYRSKTTVWSSPRGNLYYGPFGAWKIMKSIPIPRLCNSELKALIGRLRSNSKNPGLSFEIKVDMRTAARMLLDMGCAKSGEKSGEAENNERP